MKIKKSVGACAAVLAVLALGVAGCGNKSDSSKSSSDKLKSLTIMAPYINTDPPAANSTIVKKLEKLTGTDIKWQWVSNASYADKESVTMASGNLPNLMVFTSKDATFTKSVKAGAFWNLTKYIDQYPNLKKNISATTYKNSSVNGDIYGIPRSRDLMRTSVALRKDWLKKLGLSTPTNLQELQTAVTAFTKDDPDGNGKNDTYGMAVFKNTTMNTGRPWEIVATWLGAPNGWGQKSDGTIYPAFETSAYLKSLDWFKKNIAAGNINPDWATTTDGPEDTFIKGKVGLMIQPAYLIGGLPSRESASAILKTYDFTGNLPATSTSKLRSWATTGYAGLIAIPKQSVKNVTQLKQVLSFLDKTASTKGEILLNNGIEGKNFKVDQKTKYANYAVPINTDTAEYKKILNDTAAVAQISTGNAGIYKTVDKDLRGIANKRYQTMESDGKYTISNAAAPYLSETYAQKGATLDNIIVDAEVKYMAGKIDEKGWKDAIKLWEKSGGSEVIKEYTKAAKADN